MSRPVETAARESKKRPKPARSGLAVRGVVAGVLLLLAGYFGLCGLNTAVPPARPAHATQASAGPALCTRPIETFRVCDRVLGKNPELTEEDRAEFGPEPDPATWRTLELRAPKVDGSFADVTLVRPLSWLAEQGARVGGTVEISVPECGIEGSAQTINVFIAGQREPIGCAPNPLFPPRSHKT